MNLTFTRATRPELRPIPGLSGYQIDANGNVYSTRKAWNGERRRLRPGLAGNGYLTVALYKRSYTIHRLMQMAFMPETVGLLVMNHKDGNKKNNRLSNLEAVTSSENNIHALVAGLRRPRAKKETI